MLDSMDGKFNVGGVLLDRPFKIRRLGHFGINAIKMEEALHFYHALLGFKIVDIRDQYPEGREVPEEFKQFGDLRGFFFRYSHDHHAFVLYNHRFRGANDKLGRWKESITVNQITWQCGSLEEVVNANAWLTERGSNITRAGRDMPGSNWHTYVMDADWFQNELYYGIEQIGWNGHSKPWDMHDREFREIPDLPQISEYREVQDALDRGSEILSGYRDAEPLEEKFNVNGILLGRPFKITKIGPVRLFCEDMDAALAFYRDTLGFIETETVDYQGHHCIFLRNNTEHHSMALYPIALRKALGCREDSQLFAFAVRLANYQQLKNAVSFFREQGCEVREDIPQELYPGIDYTAFVVDPDGQLIQLYATMEQVGWDGRPRDTDQRRKVTPGQWPDAIDATSDSYMGEPLLGPWG
ncbi:MAG: extradiol dioxygenase [Rhodospirillaceae bacterium]|jgi:catechol 2,3-dioxygenase-like lactoylglutathione lyase family enzyme|nr:extradiol dioxygenase [Rhodospirillaceae bacterium]MBT5459540.1 extradiol dioxygenase [Rhodospirillaceae bacterium]